MYAFLDLVGHRVDRGEVALEALVGLAEAAVPASLGVVLFAIDRNIHAGRHGRDVHELGVGAVGRRPVIVAARLGRTYFLERRARREVADARIGLDILGRVVVERLAGLLVDALC